MQRFDIGREVYLRLRILTVNSEIVKAKATVYT